MAAPIAPQPETTRPLAELQATRPALVRKSGPQRVLDHRQVLAPAHRDRLELATCSLAGPGSSVWPAPARKNRSKNSTAKTITMSGCLCTIRGWMHRGWECRVA